MIDSESNTDRPLTDEEKELIVRRQKQAALGPIPFCDYWVYTYDPRVKPSNLPFLLFPYQRQLAERIRHAIEYGEDIFIDKSRDVGATYTTLMVFLWFWLYVPGSSFLLGSRKQDYVDNRFGDATGEAVSNKEESLFGKLEYMIQHLPDFMLPEGFDRKKHFGHMKLLNPENGNTISGESSNPNFSRGGRQTAILLDEFAFWENDTSAWGSTADTTNCRIVLTTPGIKPGKAKRLRFGKDGETIKVFEIDYTQDPRKNNEWEARERGRRSTDDFNREVKRNWDTAMAGLVYPEIMQVTVGVFPYNPAWPLYVSWDFGLDGTAIGWYQYDPMTGRKRLVQAYSNQDQPIQFYFPLFGSDIDSMFPYTDIDMQLIRGVGRWKPAIHYGDPDVEKRAYQSKNKTSTREALKGAGIIVQTNPDSNDFYTRWEKTKVMLRTLDVNRTYFTDRWLEAMQEAQFPQRPENSQATNEITKPIHNWTSHPRTQTEYFAVNFKEPVIIGGNTSSVNNEKEYDPYD